MENKNNSISRLLSRGNGIFVSIIILGIFLIVAAVAVPNVFQPTNLANVLRVNSPAGIMAIGLALVLLTGEIDISVGAVMSLSVMVISKIVDYSEPLSILAMLGVGAACGFLNGWIVARIRVPSLMVTIGTMSIYSGLACIITNAQAKFMTTAYPIYTTMSRGRPGRHTGYVYFVRRIGVAVLGDHNQNKVWKGHLLYGRKQARGMDERYPYRPRKNHRVYDLRHISGISGATDHHTDWQEQRRCGNGTGSYRNRNRGARRGFFRRRQRLYSGRVMRYGDNGCPDEYACAFRSWHLCRNGDQRYIDHCGSIHLWAC